MVAAHPLRRLLRQGTKATDFRSRFEVHDSVPAVDCGVADSCDPTTASISQSECLCGALRALNKRGMPGSDDLCGAGRVASCCHRICPSLSSRAQSSRPWQSVDPGRAEVFGWGCVSLSTSTTRWVTQLLPSSGRMTVGRDFAHYRRTSNGG